MLHLVQMIHWSIIGYNQLQQLWTALPGASLKLPAESVLICTSLLCYVVLVSVADPIWVILYTASLNLLQLEAAAISLPSDLIICTAQHITGNGGDILQVFLAIVLVVLLVTHV